MFLPEMQNESKFCDFIYSEKNQTAVEVSDQILNSVLQVIKFSV